jgi:hypothetical protein
MGNSFNNIGLISRTAISVAVSLCFASSVYAQSADGSIFGRTTGKATVTIESQDSGSKRSVQAEADGKFTLSKLSPGRYTVTANGVSREVTVAIGSGTEVRFQDVAVVTVAGTRTRSAIDVSSTESNTVFTQAEIQALPIPRSATAVALLAPGTVRGDEGIGAGGLPSVGGASVAENGYYVNGFDVTNIRNFTSYATLPFDAIDQQQIKTGGYGAEYGRSLGGVISLSTKRGTNKWKSGAAVYWEPNSLRAEGRNVVDKDPAHPNSYTVFNKDDKRDDLSVNLWTGGPIIKDKLFIYGIVEGKRLKTTDFAQDKATREESGVPNGMIKVDFLPTSSHRLEFTGISNKQKRKIYEYEYPEGQNYLTSTPGSAAYSEIESGGNVVIGKYTGYLTDNLTVSAQAGRVYNLVDRESGARTLGKDCPEVYDPAVNKLGCWSGIFAGGARDPNFKQDDSDTRKSGRLDLEYNWGDHTIRAGYDGQRFTSAQAGGSAYSGGVYWRYLTVPASGTINGVRNAAAPGSTWVRKRTSFQTSGVFEVENTAFYLEDSWNVTRNVLLYGGVRSESFDNKNDEGVSFVKAKNLLAPRLGASWNVNGDSSLKVYGNAGRYYIPVASNTNIRATRLEVSTEDHYFYNGMDPRTAAPLNLSAPIGISIGDPNVQLPDPGTVADTKLKPMSQDEFIFGFQQALSKTWSFGVKSIYRKVNNGMDDYCNSTGIAKWAKDNGHTKFDYHDLAGCVLMNPGEDLSLNIDLNNDGKLTNVTIPKSYLGLARYERKYKALELSVDRPFDGQWGVSGSYTFAKSTGTAEGYVQSQLDQEDAGVTQDFDFGSFTDGSNGYLPNDRRHTLKLYGAYQLSENFRLGVNMIATSGRPMSCVGFVPETAQDYYGPAGTLSGGSGEYTSASSYYCLDDKGRTRLTQRGTFGRTPWTNSIDLSLAYIKKFGDQKLTLQTDIFNIFDNRKAIEFNEVRDFSRADSRNAGPRNPANFAPGTVNPNYGNPTSFQSRRSVRFTARYEF